MIIVTKDAIIGPTPDNRGVVIFSREPVRCGGCKTMHAIFVNRHGRSFCVECDDTRAQVKP